jgi:hypothetical protein
MSLKLSSSAELKGVTGCACSGDGGRDGMADKEGTSDSSSDPIFLSSEFPTGAGEHEGI